MAWSAEAHAVGRLGKALGVCLALVATVATAIPTSATAGASAMAEGGLAVTSTYTYTVDPVANVVHVVAELALTNTVPNQISGNYINKTYFNGLSVPVPVEAVGIVATQNGSPVAVTPEPIETGAPFTLVGIEFSSRLFFNRTAAVMLTYDIAGGAPRDPGLTRINPAYTSFTAYGIADPGALTVTVVVPAGYVIDTLGSDAVESVDEGGNTVYTATDIAQPAEFALLISARNDAALTAETRTVNSIEFTVQSWPDDAPWREFVNDRLDRGVPALVELIGRPWPETEPIEISEAVTSYLYGYAGWYNSGNRKLELGEDLDAQTVVHELSHVWFNNDWYVDRWITEGLAQHYAGLANEQLGEPPVSPDAIEPGAAGAGPLSGWADPDVTDAVDEAEEFGYNASWFVIDGIVDDIGVDAMRQVFEATDARTISYVGDAPAEEMLISGDWRRFLDLTEIVAGSTVAHDLIARHVVMPEDQAMLDDRSTARTTYAELQAAGDDWAPPLVVRKYMTRWEFEDATAMMSEATDALAQRDTLIATLDGLGVAIDPALEAEYEASAASLDSAVALLDDTAAEADAVVATRDEALQGLSDLGVEPTPAFTTATVTPESSLGDVASELDDVIDATADVQASIGVVDADRGFLERIGMIGTDVDTVVEAAKAALADGDTATARTRAAEATQLIADSHDVGRTRVVYTAAAVVGVLVLVLALILVIRRKHRRRRTSSVVDGSAASFETVAHVYDAARPAYPAGVYDALGALAGLRVLDVGAGTGIATRELLARSADVIAVDRGPSILSRAVAQSPALNAIVADGATLPIRDATIDLLCCAQAWHWFDAGTRAAEAHRVLAPDGRWAAWWSHARADDEPWFDTYWSLIEAACPGTHRGQRDIDWGADLARSGLFEVGERITVRWTRDVSAQDWIADQTTHSYVVAMSEPDRSNLLDQLRAVVDQQFPSGAVTVPYETWLWIGTKR